MLITLKKSNLIYHFQTARDIYFDIRTRLKPCGSSKPVLAPKGRCSATEPKEVANYMANILCLQGFIANNIAGCLQKTEQILL